MKFCVPRTAGRGAGLGNEIIPWGKAFIAATELDANVGHPAWGLNRRRYYKTFGTSRFDWLGYRTLATLLPTYRFRQQDYINIGKIDFGDAVRVFAQERGLFKKKAFVLYVEGMWGGYASIASARQFIWTQLISSRSALANLYRVRQRLSPNKVSIGVHIRLGDFKQPIELEKYRGKFNVSLPLEWYFNVCRELRSAFNDRVQFLLFSDGGPDKLSAFIQEFQPVTTFDLTNTDCSDVLAMAGCDLAVCSVSSYSMLSAFLGQSPYLWFAPQLQHHEGDWLSLWGHEANQQDPNSPTLRNLRFVSNHQGAKEQSNLLSRGIPICLDGKLPHGLINWLERRWSQIQPEGDLIMYGLVKAGVESP